MGSARAGCCSVGAISLAAEDPSCVDWSAQRVLSRELWSLPAADITGGNGLLTVWRLGGFTRAGVWLVSGPVGAAEDLSRVVRGACTAVPVAAYLCGLECLRVLPRVRWSLPAALTEQEMRADESFF